MLGGAPLMLDVLCSHGILFFYKTRKKKEIKRELFT
jgi:hypothetical protein